LRIGVVAVAFVVVVVALVVVDVAVTRFFVAVTFQTKRHNVMQTIEQYSKSTVFAPYFLYCN
jgi:hypothetical protein